MATNASTCLRVTCVTCCDAMNATMRWPSPFQAGVQVDQSVAAVAHTSGMLRRARPVVAIALANQVSLMLSASYNDDAVNCEQDQVDVANTEPVRDHFR